MWEIFLKTNSSQPQQCYWYTSFFQNFSWQCLLRNHTQQRGCLPQQPHCATTPLAHDTLPITVTKSYLHYINWVGDPNLRTCAIWHFMNTSLFGTSSFLTFFMACWQNVCCVLILTWIFQLERISTTAVSAPFTKSSSVPLIHTETYFNIIFKLFSKLS